MKLIETENFRAMHYLINRLISTKKINFLLCLMISNIYMEKVGGKKEEEEEK